MSAAAKKWDVLLVAATSRPCAYDSTGQPPECPEEWPGEPWKWCGSCLARAVTRP